MNLSDALSNTRCLAKACEKLGIQFFTHDDFGNWLELNINGKKLQFINRNVPFNSGSIFKLCKDKEFSYRLFHKELKMAKSKGYVDPDCNSDYSKFVLFKDKSSITKDILENFNFPLIIKMNSGSLGTNVFIVNSEKEIYDSLTEIFNKDSENYDYLSLAQEFINIDREFRIIWFKEEPLLIYEKVVESKHVSISPMFNPDAKTVNLDQNEKTYKELVAFIKSSKTLINQIEYAGFDIAIDKSGQTWLLEINASPILDKFARDHGDDALVSVYEKMLNIIQNYE